MTFQELKPGPQYLSTDCLFALSIRTSGLVSRQRVPTVVQKQTAKPMINMTG